MPTTPPFARAPKAPLPLTELSDEAFILYPEHSRRSFAGLILPVCDQAGFQPEQLVLVMGCQTAVSLAPVGVGVSPAAQSVSSSRHAGIIYRPYAGPNPGTALSVSYRIDNRALQLWSFFAGRPPGGSGGEEGGLRGRIGNVPLRAKCV